MAMVSQWGAKYACFSCGCKFYDLGRPAAVCPKCDANQADRRKAAEEALLAELAREEEELEPAEDDGVGASDDDLPEMEEELGYDENAEVADSDLP